MGVYDCIKRPRAYKLGLHVVMGQHIDVIAKYRRHRYHRAFQVQQLRVAVLVIQRPKRNDVILTLECESHTVSVIRTPTLFVKVCVTGAIYFNDCPMQRFIPIYLLVAGAISAFELLCGSVKLLCRQRLRDHGRVESYWDDAGSLVGCFMVAWFIAG